MNLSGRLIDAFLALEETKRFSVAAERCHVSASAFSQMISRLEEIVGARLFDRDTRNVLLTPEGEAFLVGARRIASEMEASMRQMSERAALRTGRVAVAAPPSLTADWLPAILAQYRSSHPHVGIQVHDVVSNRCLSMIAAGEVDFGLNAQRGNSREFKTQLLFNERLFLVCRHDDPLAARDHVSFSHLQGRSFIHTVRSGSVWQRLAGMLATIDVVDSGLEVSQFGTLAGLIVHGFGISVVPEYSVQLCKRPELLAIPLHDKHATRPIYMVKRAGRSLLVAAEELWTQIVNRVEQGGTLPSGHRGTGDE